MGPVLAVIAIVGNVAQYRAQKKAKAAAARRQAELEKQQLEAQREANQIAARPSATNQPLPAVYGRAGVPAVAVYSRVGRSWVNRRTGATDRRISGDRGFSKNAQPRYTILLRQYDISVGRCEEITYCLIDGEPFDSPKFAGAQDIAWAYGDLDEGATLVLTGGVTEVGGDERRQGVFFAGLTFASAGFWLNLDAETPAYGGFPELFFYCSGIRTEYITIDPFGAGSYQLSSSGEAPIDHGRLAQIFPYARLRSNPALILFDWISQQRHFGPRLDTGALDFKSFARASAVCADSIAFSRVNDRKRGTAGKYDTGVTAEPAGLPMLDNNFYSRPYPLERNIAAGSSYATYSEYLAVAAGLNNLNPDGLTIEDETNRFGAENETLNRYEWNGHVPTSRKWFDIIDRIEQVIPGAIFFRSATGKWKLAVPNPHEPLADVPVFDEFFGDFEIDWPDVEQRVNRIICKFPDIESDWAGGFVEFPAPGSVLDQQLRAADGGVFRRTLNLSGTCTRIHAKSIAAGEILQSRRPDYIFTVGRQFALYEEGDIVRLRRARLPAVDVHVLIQDRNVNPDLTVRFSAILYSPWDYDFYCTDTERLPLKAVSAAEADQKFGPPPAAGG